MSVPLDIFTLDRLPGIFSTDFESPLVDEVSSLFVTEPQESSWEPSSESPWWTWLPEDLQDSSDSASPVLLS